MNGDSDLPLSLKNLSVQVAGHEIVQVKALDVRPGDLIHLIGENGAGKTTLFRALAGELPHSGALAVCGHPPQSVAARRHLAFVPTEAALPDDLTVREYLTFMAAAWEGALAPLLELARSLGLERFLDDWPVTLSRGTRQKVALAAALGLARPVTLLDEPFSTLDAASREVLADAIHCRARAGGALIVTTHGPELTGTTRRLTLSGGLLQSGPA